MASPFETKACRVALNIRYRRLADAASDAELDMIFATSARSIIAIGSRASSLRAMSKSIGLSAYMIWRGKCSDR